MSSQQRTNGPLAQRVVEYEQVMRELVPQIESPADWAPLAALVAVERFARTGVFMEVQDWSQYVEMLTSWARSIDSFETSPRRVTETENLVFYEIEERHYRGDDVNVVHSMTVFGFNQDTAICRLDVYLQQAVAPPRELLLS